MPKGRPQKHVPREIGRMYRQGKTLAELAPLCDMTPHTLAKKLRAMGVPIRKTGPVPGTHQAANRKTERNARVVECLLNGMEAKDVARKFGISRRRVLQLASAAKLVCKYVWVRGE